MLRNDVAAGLLSRHKEPHSIAAATKKGAIFAGVVISHLLFLIPTLASGDYEELGWGVASAGMSNSVMFSKNIPSLFYINPAASSYFEKLVI